MAVIFEIEIAIIPHLRVKVILELKSYHVIMWESGGGRYQRNFFPDAKIKGKRFFRHKLFKFSG